MAISWASEADVLVNLHRGIRDDATWHSFLVALRRQTGAEIVGLMVQTRMAPSDATGAVHACALGVGTIDLGVALFGQGQVDIGLPDPLGLQRLRSDRVYALSELSDPTDRLKTTFAADLGAALHAKYMRIMRVSVQPGTDAWLVIARAATDLSASASALMASLAPHLTVAVRNHLDRELTLQRIALSVRTSQRLGLGWILFSPQGNVIDLCDAARALMLGAGMATPVIGSRLFLPSAVATRTMTEALTRAATHQGAEALVLWAEPRLELLLSPVGQNPLPPAMGAPIVGYLRATDVPLHTQAAALETLYGLATSEAKFALLLGQAKDIATAASHLGLTIETGRNYSKKIYAKTGVSGQAELIFLIANGVASLRALE